jgi:hypothetical protein
LIGLVDIILKIELFDFFFMKHYYYDLTSKIAAEL